MVWGGFSLRCNFRGVQTRAVCKSSHINSCKCKEAAALQKHQEVAEQVAMAARQRF